MDDKLQLEKLEDAMLEDYLEDDKKSIEDIIEEKWSYEEDQIDWTEV